MTVVYLDSYFLLNFVVNALLLACAGKLDGGPPHPLRCGLGAGLGAVYALVTLLPGWAFLSHPVWAAAMALGMLLAAYGCRERLLRVGALFLVLSCAFGGGLLFLSVGGAGGTLGVLGPALGMRGILISGALSYGALCLLLGRQFSHRGPKGELTPLTLTRGERSVTLSALLDTGNTLRDPLTGRPVVVVEGEKLRSLIPELPRLDREALSDPVAFLEGREACPDLRLLPYRAVGVDCGLLLALRLDRAEWGGHVQRNCLTALSPTAVSDGGNYSALIGAAD